MASRLLVSIGFIVCFSHHILQEGLAAEITITASKHQAQKAESVDVTCNPDGSEGDSRELVILQVRGPGGNMLVSLERNQQVVFDGKLSHRYTASGDHSKGTLTLTIQDPQAEDFGDYSCSVTYKDLKGKAETHVTKGHLSESDVASKIETRLNALELKTAKLEAALEEKTRKEAIKSIFSAQATKPLSVSIGQKVVFPDVTLAYGLAGYDSKTGVYTVPADGVYQFHVRVTAYCKNCVFIGYIKVNGLILAGVGAHDKDYYDQTSVTTIADFKKGDKVYLETSSLENTEQIYPHTFSSFYGFLVEAH